MKQIRFLLNTMPDWASATKSKLDELMVAAKSLKPSGDFGKTVYNLAVEGNDWGGVSISEAALGTAFPACCVERHINPGGSFCLYLNSTHPLESNEDASKLWHALGVFLFHQEYSARQGVWPVGAAYSHGQSANQQIEMEQLADLVGWKDEVLQGIFRHQGWLGGDLPRLSKKGDCLVNARTPCPRSCLRLHPPMSRKSCEQKHCFDGCAENHVPMLRAECPNRRTVERLVLLEYQRRKIEEEFFHSLKKQGITCCGTMKGCPLASDS